MATCTGFSFQQKNGPTTPILVGTDVGFGCLKECTANAPISSYPGYDYYEVL